MSPGTTTTSAMRRPRNAWMTPPFRSSVRMEAPLASVTQNRDNRAFQNRRGFCRSRGPQPPAKADGRDQSYPWRPSAEAADGGSRCCRQRQRAAAAALGSTRSVPGLIRFLRATPSEPILSKNMVLLAPKGTGCHVLPLPSFGAIWSDHLLLFIPP